MKNSILLTLALVAMTLFALSACTRTTPAPNSSTTATSGDGDNDHDHDHADGDHDHGDHDHPDGDDDHDHDEHGHDDGGGDGDGHDHDGDDHAGHDHADDDDHDHAEHDDHDHGDEVPLGTAKVGDMDVEFAQGHGDVEPGKEMHLIVKLPYNDSGASIVRAWIGSDDPLASIVGRGDYAASHDDYDIHVEAPDPLPSGAAWWVEVEKPDGTVHTGSIAFK